MIREIERTTLPGLLAIGVLLVLIALFVYFIVASVNADNSIGIVVSGLFLLLSLLAWPGLFIVNPNEAKVLQLFGKYAGTAREPGLRYANPFRSEEHTSQLQSRGHLVCSLLLDRKQHKEPHAV